LILTDNHSNKPILDFDSYSDVVVKIIKESHPNFTVGIIGEWGTGKTTLMKSIKNQLDKDKENIITVWFDAWKYENEKQFALIPLLKTISYSIKDDKDEKKKNLKETIKEAAIFALGISIFLDVNLEGVNLVGANLTDVIIINALSYNELKVNSKTNILNAIIDDPKLVDYLQGNKCINVPDKINNKSILREKLERRGLNADQIEDMIALTKLPD
jgi:nucleoside-triphosphatase THEP1